MRKLTYFFGCKHPILALSYRNSTPQGNKIAFLQGFANARCQGDTLVPLIIHLCQKNMNHTCSRHKTLMGRQFAAFPNLLP